MRGRSGGGSGVLRGVRGRAFGGSESVRAVEYVRSGVRYSKSARVAIVYKESERDFTDPSKRKGKIDVNWSVCLTIERANAV